MFITPRVVESEIDMKGVIEDLRKRMEKIDDSFNVFTKIQLPRRRANSWETISLSVPASPDGDKKTSPKPDISLLRPRNGNLGHSLSGKTPLTMPEALVRLDSRIAVPQGGGAEIGRSSAISAAAPYLFFSGAIQMDQQGFGSRSFRARIFRWLARSLGVAVIVAVAGCSTMGGITKDSTPEAKREAVTERVNARWAALIKGDMDTAYTFLSPASRAVTSLSVYKAQARGKGYQRGEDRKSRLRNRSVQSDADGGVRPPEDERHSDAGSRNPGSSTKDRSGTSGDTRPGGRCNFSTGGLSGGIEIVWTREASCNKIRTLLVLK